MAPMQPIASTHVDANNNVFTFGALQDLADQINNHVRKPPMWVNHDRTVPPLGMTTAARVEPIDEAHHQLLVEYDVFPEPLPVDLPNGESGYRQFSKKARHPFVTAEFEDGKGTVIGVDTDNFESREEVDRFFSDIRSEQRAEFAASRIGRRALTNDPELIIKLSLQAAGVWFGVRIASVVAKVAEDIMAEELKNVYRLIRTTIIKYASYARPKNRPITYVLQIPGTPNLELVSRTSDPHEVLMAFKYDTYSALCSDIAEFSRQFEPELIQFILGVDGKWRFNYLLTEDGISIGSRQSYSRRAILLNKLRECARRESLYNDTTDKDVTL